jgi:hypothetical protein
MPQIISSLIFGLSFVSERHAANELGWLQSERRRLHSALAAMIVVAVGSFIGLAKADPRWCAVSNQGTGNCSFTTIEQCHAKVSGIGGFCLREAPVGHRQPTRASIEAARKETP